jgi:hypothetical protein
LLRAWDGLEAILLEVGEEHRYETWHAHTVSAQTRLAKNYQGRHRALPVPFRGMLSFFFNTGKSFFFGNTQKSFWELPNLQRD